MLSMGGDFGRKGKRRDDGLAKKSREEYDANFVLGEEDRPFDPNAKTNEELKAIILEALASMVTREKDYSNFYKNVSNFDPVS